MITMTKTAFTHFTYACSAVMAVVCATLTASIVTTYGYSGSAGWLPETLDALANMPHANPIIALVIGGLLLAGIADSWRRDLTKTAA